MDKPEFLTVWVTDKQVCHPTAGAHTLIIKNRGDADVELSLEGDHTFLVKPEDPFLYLGPSKFNKICYKRTTPGPKVRLDIAILR